MKHFLVAVILLVGTAMLLSLAETVRPVHLLRPLSKFPSTIGSFQAVEDSTFSEPLLANLGVDYYLMRSYMDSDGYLIWLYIGFYETQAEGRIIHSPKHCMPGSGWNPFVEEEVSVVVDEQRFVTIDQMQLQKGHLKMIAHYWYQGRGRMVPNEYVDRWYMLLDSLLIGRSDGALVRITGSGENFELNKQKQHQFISDLLKITGDFLPGREINL